MLLDLAKFGELRQALKRSMVNTLETHQGECIAVDDGTGEEWSHKWRDGQTVVCVEDDDSSTEYVFVARLELVAVESV